MKEQTAQLAVEVAILWGELEAKLQQDFQKVIKVGTTLAVKEDR